MSAQDKDKKKKKRKEPVWPGGVSPKAAGCGYLELVQPIYDRFKEKAEKTAKKPEPPKDDTPEKDDLPSPESMGCGYLRLPDRPRR